jgi:hypothetical protein
MAIQSLRERYLARGEALRPGEALEGAGQVLEAAGDLVRRRAALGGDLGAVDRALGQLSDAALSRWREGLAVAAVEGHLRRALWMAVEAAVPDEEEDVTALIEGCMQELRARDRLESALVALERLGAQGRLHAAALGRTLRGEVAQVDSACRPAVAGLTPLNPLRRPEAALLDDAERARAWWFSVRCGVEDDLLVPVLGGERPGTVGRGDRQASEVVSEWRTRPVSSEALLRIDLGLACPAEAREVRRRAQHDPELALALTAMEAGEAAIEALERAPAEPATTTTSRPAAAPDVVHRHPDFTVLVFSGPRMVRVRVEPRQPGRLAAAALHREGTGGQGLTATPDPSGLEFEVVRPGPQTVRLVVTLTGGATAAVELALG